MRPRKQEETVKDMGRQSRARAQPHTNIMTDVGRMVGAAAAEAEVRKKCGSGRSGSQRACRKESLSAAEVALGAEGAARGSLSERRKCGSAEVWRKCRFGAGGRRESRTGGREVQRRLLAPEGEPLRSAREGSRQGRRRWGIEE